MFIHTLQNGCWGFFYILNLGTACSGSINIDSFLNTEQFAEALITGKKKLSLVEPLTDEDRTFLQSIFCPVLNQSIVDLSKFDMEKIQGYAIVLKQIDGKNFEDCGIYVQGSPDLPIMVYERVRFLDLRWNFPP